MSTAITVPVGTSCRIGLMGTLSIIPPSTSRWSSLGTGGNTPGIAALARAASATLPLRWMRSVAVVRSVLTQNHGIHRSAMSRSPVVASSARMTARPRASDTNGRV